MADEQDIAYWRGLKRATTREEFAEDHTHPFLLRKRMAHTSPVQAAPQDDGDWGGELQYNTDVVDMEQLPTRSAGRMAGGKVVPVVKSERDPFSGQISVGRAMNCDIILRDSTVSKHHAYFQVLDASSAEVVDTDSHNTTRVNGKPIAPRVATRVVTGDTISFGGVVCLFLDAHALHRML
jgi:hypothetical protein